MQRFCDGNSALALGARPFRFTLLLVAVSVLTVGCAPRSSWEEEVSIAPGEPVTVERDARFGSAGAVGSPKFSFPIRQALRVNLASGRTGDWVSALTNRFIPESTLRPLYLHRDDEGQLVMVAGFYFCENWPDFDHPSPPYLAFRWTGKNWDLVDVPDAFWERDSNLLADLGPKTGLRLNPAEIKKRNSQLDEYEAKLMNVRLLPNCGMWASDELQKYRRQ
jgi:hypothetical protein